jgi:hypothetical protein
MVLVNHNHKIVMDINTLLSSFGAWLHHRWRDRDMQTLQQAVDERISFLKEQISPQNKPEENKTFQLQIEAIRSAANAGDTEEVEVIIAERRRC